jgi:hypothetical protein
VQRLIQNRIRNPRGAWVFKTRGLARDVLHGRPLKEEEQRMRRERIGWMILGLTLTLGVLAGCNNGIPTCASGDNAAARAIALAGADATNCGTFSTFYWLDGGSFTGTFPSASPSGVTLGVGIGDGGIAPDDGGNAAEDCAVAAIGSAKPFLLTTEDFDLYPDLSGSLEVYARLTHSVAGSPSHQIASFWDGCADTNSWGDACTNNVIVEDTCSASSAACLSGDAGFTDTTVCQTNPNPPSLF